MASQFSVDPQDPQYGQMPSWLGEAMQGKDDGYPNGNPESQGIPSYILQALRNQPGTLSAYMGGDPGQQGQPQAPQGPMDQVMAPQAPQGPMGQPQAPQAPRKDMNSIYDGLINGGAALLGARNLKEGLGAGVQAFNQGYDDRTNKDRELNQPKVTPLADGAFTLLQFSNGTQKVVKNSEVAGYLNQQKVDAAKAKGDAIVLQAQVNSAVASGKKADEASLTHAGDEAQTAGNVKELRDLAGELGKTDTATGPIVGSLPKAVRDVITPEGASLQDRAERVVQAGLRGVLGSQYTENEGKAFMARAYNPRLSEAENARRLSQAADELEQLAKDKAGAIEHLRSKGTLAGFKPNTSASSGNAPAINSQADYAALPSGSLFRAPDGSTRRKP